MNQDLGFPPLRERPLPKPNWQLVLSLILGVLLIAALWSSAFSVEPEEVGLVLRFGKHVRNEEPGLHWKLPYPIEIVQRVPVQRRLKAEFGFRTLEPGVQTRYSSKSFERESLMLTGDRNVAVVEWTTQYRVSDPYKFLFSVRDLDSTFSDLNEAAMREAIGDRGVLQVLTTGRSEIQSDVKELLQLLCDEYETGLVIENILLQDVNPPDPVKPSFNEVNQAQQERDRLINEAESEFNRVVPEAKGEAKREVQSARGYAIDRVNRAKGDVLLFDQLRRAYEAAPEVTRARIFLETMRDVLPKVRSKIVVDEQIKGLLPFLDLGEAKR